MSRKRGKKLREERRAKELEAPAFPYAMRMTRQRAHRLRKLRLLEGIRLPAFPRFMRMSRQRKRQMREKEELSRELTQVAAASLTAIYVAQSVPQHAHSAPLSTFTDVSSYFDYMRCARDRIQGRKAAEEQVSRAREGRLQAERDWLSAQDGVRKAGEDMRASEELLGAMEQQQAKIRIALQRARDAYEIRTKEAAESRQAVEDFLPQVYEQQTEAERLAALLAEREEEYQSYQSSLPSAPSASGQGSSLTDSRRAEIIEDTWKSVEYAQNRLHDVYAMVEQQIAREQLGSSGEPAGFASQIPYYEDRVEAARQEADEAQEVLDDLEAQLDSLRNLQSEAEDAEADVRQEISALEQDQVQAEKELQAAEQDYLEKERGLAEANLWLQETEKSVDRAAAEEIKAEYELEHFGEGHSYGLGMEYYSWHGNESGYQLYMPLEISGEEEGWDWSIETGYVTSSSGKKEGSVSGWTATDISATLHNDHPVNDVRYKMTVSLPTGPSNAHANANLPEDLARRDSFHQGWNWTPQLEFIHHITERDSITSRMSWTWRGSYDSRWDDMMGRVVSAKTSPGNVWKQESEYLHAGEHHQFLGILSHQSTTSAQLGDAWYKDGDETALKLFYSKDISPKDSFQAYGIIGYGTGAKSRDAADLGGRIWRQYYGLGWTHQIRKGESWWTMVNYMKTNGADFNYATGQPMSNRQRWSLQLGYDHRLDESSMLRLKLESYSLRDRAAGNFHGWNTAIMYYHSF